MDGDAVRFLAGWLREMAECSGEHRGAVRALLEGVMMGQQAGALRRNGPEIAALADELGS